MKKIDLLLLKEMLQMYILFTNRPKQPKLLTGNRRKTKKTSKSKDKKESMSGITKKIKE